VFAVTTQLELSAKLAAIGAQLKQMRENKSLTLDEVQASTLIPKSHLQAIEEGNLDVLPELVYVQGFIRKYGRAMGLVEIGTELTPDPLPTPPVSPDWELRPWHLWGIYATIVVGAISVLALVFREPYPTNREVVAPPVPQSEPVPVKAVAEPQDQLPVKLSVEMVGESWMRVTVDGRLEFEGMMGEGRIEQWSGEQEIVLRAGNAAAVKATFNQNPPQILGDEGEVVELVFNATTNRPQQ
jgi:Uncharacterized protein conserved in bacteria